MGLSDGTYMTGIEVKSCETRELERSARLTIADGNRPWQQCLEKMQS